MSTTTQDPKALLESILKNLGFGVTVEEIEKGGSKVLDIQAPDDSGRLIGRKGQTLLDLQYLLNRILFQHDKESAKVQIDVGGYRFSEDDKLVDQAKKAAEQVRRWGDIVELEPMNSYNRRIIHNTLKDDPDIETQSVEVDGTHDKAIILRPKN
ncbi:MAG TPA: KH domain-containing protein [Verrucomicrobiota bacterium]|nr:KH domain-containing protein [Verrucomicrobiota bacterium]